MRLVIFCLFFSFFASLSHGKVLSDSIKSYENHSVLRVKITSKENFDLLSSIDGIHFWNDGHIGGNADIMVTPQDIERVKTNLFKNGFEFTTMIENVGELMRLEKVPKDRDELNMNSEHRMSWTEYHNQEDIESFVDYLAEKYDFVELEHIGESHEGRSMRVVKVCKNGCGNKPAMWIDGGIHAREWIAPAALTWMLHELVENDKDHTDLTEKLDWYILPFVNPDGYAYTRSKDRLWRKTRSQTTFLLNERSENDGFCKGTDANRNWDFHWNEGGSSHDGCSDTYHGETAFSEIENRNVRDFVFKNKDNIEFFNTLHAYSQMVLIPYGFTEEHVPSYQKLKNLADKSNEALYAVHGTEYKVGCIPCLLYVASGGSMDWALGVAGISYSYGMELRDTGLHGFLLPPDQIIPTAEETWAFHKHAARMIIDEFA